MKIFSYFYSLEKMIFKILDHPIGRKLFIVIVAIICIIYTLFSDLSQLTDTEKKEIEQAIEVEFDK